AEPPNQVPGGDRAPLRLAPGADVQRRVNLPASERATQAKLVDRATGDVYELSWPPVAAALQRVPDLPAEPAVDAPDDGPNVAPEASSLDGEPERSDQSSQDGPKGATPGSSAAPPSTTAPLPSGQSTESTESSPP